MSPAAGRAQPGPASVGVVIVTRDRRESLLRTLSRLAALEEAPPVVVVDNGSRDGTADAVRRAYPGVRLERLARDVGPAARTIGARALDTELVAFCDDDSWWAPGALARADAVFAAHPRLGLLAARILVGPRERLDPASAEMRDSPLPAQADLPGPPVLGFLACGAILRRSALLAIGGFAPRLDFGGEEELVALDLMTAGWTLAYVDDVVAHHHPPPSSRHRPARDRTQLRNALWTAWLRRRAPGAARTTARLCARALRTGQGGALLDAVRGLPWVLPRRRPVPRHVERAARILDG